LQEKHGEQQRAEQPQRSVNSFHAASYTPRHGRVATVIVRGRALANSVRNAITVENSDSAH
jgi:hypothetical protein